MTKDGEEAVRTVTCEIHGTKAETFVCQHIVLSLRENRPYGFFWTTEGDQEFPDAWCSACEERVRETGGGWTAELEAFTRVQLLCSDCYLVAKALNGLAKK